MAEKKLLFWFHPQISQIFADNLFAFFQNLRSSA